jgi:hypothetical protein
VLVVAFFAAPAMAQCTGLDCGCGFQAVDFSLGNWPDNANVDLFSQKEQRALAFWNGDATNDVAVQKDQKAGITFAGQFPVEACTCSANDNLVWNNRVVNIERIDIGNQFATATGYATAKNRISICSTQDSQDGPTRSD